jgi:hypothetical protein
MTTVDPGARVVRARRGLADLITLVALATIIAAIVLGAVLALVEANGYGARQYMHDLVLLCFALVVLLFSRTHVRGDA